jgi:acyl-CoA thioesterase
LKSASHADEPPKDAQALAERVARAMFARDEASRALGVRILEIKPGFARLSMVVRRDMVNGHEICHGGLVFALADSAFAFACNSYNRITVAAAATIDFVAPAKFGDELTAVAEERFRSRRAGVYDVRVLNAAGDCVALFRGRSHQLDGTVTDT